MDTKNYATDPVCNDLLQHLFGDLTDLMREIAPDGWEMSPFVRIHHPSPEQRQAEITAMYEGMNRLSWARTNTQEPYTVPTIDELRQEQTNNPGMVRPQYELLDLCGGCIWAIFSNNHDVIGANGEVYSLGSFRGTGTFIADFLQNTYPDAPTFDYMNFYCADGSIERRADVTPIYTLIFKRLKAKQCDWVYSFPRTHLISFDSPDDTSMNDPATYDPNVAMAETTEREQRREETAKLQAELDREVEEAMEEALYQAPPMIIQAYYAVYERFPVGWVNA